LKPQLARGELRCIGATTLDEYRKYIEKDPALERRFQQVRMFVYVRFPPAVTQGLPCQGFFWGERQFKHATQTADKKCCCCCWWLHFAIVPCMTCSVFVINATQVYVDQPTVAQTVSILRGLRERYEVHHGVRISDSALVEAAVLSDRYLADR
jgi:hypothetical protein